MQPAESSIRRPSPNVFQMRMNFQNSRSSPEARTQQPYGLVGLIFFQAQFMRNNIRTLHERDNQSAPSADGTQYKSPNPKNIGLLERWGFRKPTVKKEIINGVEVELTYHPRTGGRSVVEVTGGPSELVGYTSSPVKNGSNWAIESRKQVEQFIQSKSDSSIKMATPEQMRDLAQGKYGDVKIQTPTEKDSSTTRLPKDDYKTIQDQERHQQAELANSSEHLKNGLREHRHELENAKIQKENAIWEHNQLTKDPKLGLPLDKAQAVSEVKEQIEHFQSQENAIEDLIASEQQKKDQVDQKRKELEELQRIKNDRPATGPKEKPRGYREAAEKAGQDFKQGAKAEFKRQIELENAIGTLGNAAGDGLVKGGIKVAAVLNNEGSFKDAMGAVAETAKEVAVDTLKTTTASIVWEGAREVIQQNLPQVSEYVPALGTAIKAGRLAKSALEADTPQEAAYNVGCTAADMGLQTGCQAGGAAVGAAVGSLIANPVAGAVVGAVVGGAVGTGSYVAIRHNQDEIIEFAKSPEAAVTIGQIAAWLMPMSIAGPLMPPVIVVGAVSTVVLSGQQLVRYMMEKE
jgi:hypothetical protein